MLGGTLFTCMVIVVESEPPEFEAVIVKVVLERTELGVPVIWQELEIDKPLGKDGEGLQVVIAPPVLLISRADIVTPRVRVSVFGL